MKMSGNKMKTEAKALILSIIVGAGGIFPWEIRKSGWVMSVMRGFDFESCGNTRVELGERCGYVRMCKVYVGVLRGVVE
jgi:hypothetical protein